MDFMTAALAKLLAMVTALVAVLSGSMGGTPAGSMATISEPAPLEQLETADRMSQRGRCPGQVVTIVGWETDVECDVVPPQWLVIIPGPAESADVQRCWDHGGTIQSWPVWQCLKVDY